LGATLLEALTDSPPFLRPDLVAQHLGEPPPSPSARRPGLAPAHDAVLGRALAKAPEERFASALEMAEAVLAWPVDLVAAPLGRPGRERSRPVASPTATPADRELARTPDGRLVLRHDPRTGRDMLVEERETPLAGAALDALRALAAAGGPRVQRVLALSPDRRAIFYEIPEGQREPLAALVDAERAMLAEAFAALPPGRTTHFIRTTAGPVLWIAPGLD
jgi:hypothetical protein